MELVFSWGGNKYPVTISPEDSVATLKEKIFASTLVEPQRQKIFGLVKSKFPEDNVLLGSLGLKDGQAFMMVGTPEQNMLKVPDVPYDILDDFDMDYWPSEEEMNETAAHRKKLEDRIQKVKINILNPPRKNKLLVLDLDFTLFDCKSPAENFNDLARPGMHELLRDVYPFYDIVIWSQTSLRYLEMKISRLGLMTHPDYKICFVLDKSSMFSVDVSRKGEKITHSVKALEFIWRSFPQFSSKNTIHVDDLSRNFAMNPQNGLKIAMFKNAPTTRASDRELFPLARYLIKISSAEDLSKLDHKQWKSSLSPSER